MKGEQNMRRLGVALGLSMLATIAAGCTNAVPMDVTDPPEATITVTPVETTQVPEETPVTIEPSVPTGEAPQVTEEAVPVAWKEIYTEFIAENYTELAAACMDGLAGVGFIDLDLDGTAEMLIFDVGASAAMGVQIFDIVDGKVECISANMTEVRTKFGGEHSTKNYVNTVRFDSFRLMKDKATGESFFCVESSNGANDFTYTELIQFGNSNGIVTLTKLLYKYEEYDEEGNIISARFSTGDATITESEYTAKYEEFTKKYTDTGYEATGVFIWKDDAYYNEFDGFVSMMNEALKQYVPLTAPAD